MSTLYHAAAAFSCGSKNDLSAECFHDLTTFDRERFSHGGNERISLGGTDHCQRNTCITRGCFDDSLAWLESAAAFALLNNGERKSVFH